MRQRHQTRQRRLALVIEHQNKTPKLGSKMPIGCLRQRRDNITTETENYAPETDNQLNLFVL